MQDFKEFRVILLNFKRFEGTLKGFHKIQYDIRGIQRIPKNDFKDIKGFTTFSKKFIFRPALLQNPYVIDSSSPRNSKRFLFLKILEEFNRFQGIFTEFPMNSEYFKRFKRFAKIFKDLKEFSENSENFKDFKEFYGILTVCKNIQKTLKDNSS